MPKMKTSKTAAKRFKGGFLRAPAGWWMARTAVPLLLEDVDQPAQVTPLGSAPSRIISVMSTAELVATTSQ